MAGSGSKSGASSLPTKKVNNSQEAIIHHKHTTTNYRIKMFKPTVTTTSAISAVDVEKTRKKRER
jgi:hypothetical protein